MSPEQVETLVQQAVEHSGLNRLNELSTIAEVSAALDALSAKATQLPERSRMLLGLEAKRQLQAAKVRCPASAVDAALRTAQEGTSGDAAAVPVATVDPWPEPVELESLLEKLTSTVRSHVALTAAEADAIALWILHTHA
ncbi:MAG: hypothetical protein OXR73_10555, partial [Myxococcales bacterium]|nr:hypothetical protein [Myxococcales bacterium]